jgi:peptidoglycan/LPS O-acetylase OafA/YrhL
MPPVLVSVAGWLGYTYHEPGRLNFLLGSLASIALAALSWELVEDRINALKRYFGYESKPGQQGSTAPSQGEGAVPPARVGITP